MPSMVKIFSSTSTYLLDLIVRVAQPQPTDVVLEVGTGTGSLTVRLAEQVAHVITVEIDPHLAQMALEQFDKDAPLRCCSMMCCGTRITFATMSWTQCQADGRGSGRHFKLVANLPYSVATPIISNLLASDLPPDSMTVTIQKEYLADRVTAAPRLRGCGSLVFG